MAEVAVHPTFVVKLSNEEFKLICLMLDGKDADHPDSPVRAEARASMRELAGKLLKTRADMLRQMTEAAERAFVRHSEDTAKMEGST